MYGGFGMMQPQPGFGMQPQGFGQPPGFGQGQPPGFSGQGQPFQPHANFGQPSQTTRNASEPPKPLQPPTVPTPVAEAVQPNDVSPALQPVIINIGGNGGAAPAAPAPTTTKIPEEQNQNSMWGKKRRGDVIWEGSSSAVRYNVRDEKVRGSAICCNEEWEERWDFEEKHEILLTERTIEMTKMQYNMNGERFMFEESHINKSDVVGGEGRCSQIQEDSRRNERGVIFQVRLDRNEPNMQYTFTGAPHKPLIMNESSYITFKEQMREWGIF